ncbi:MAG: hypothetical protein ACO3RV_04455 [Luteolibacter sp.]
MKSKKNLTRYTYESTSFQGWRMSLSRSGCSFTKYFSDKQYGGAKKSLLAAEVALEELKKMLDGAPRRNGKLTSAIIKRANKLLARDPGARENS